jgi:hypothetical protein
MKREEKYLLPFGVGLGRRLASESCESSSILALFCFYFSLFFAVVGIQNLFCCYLVVAV